MTEKIRDSFIFYRSFYQSAKKLPKEDKAELFDAICCYALDGDLIDLSVVPEAIFTVIQPNLDANRRKWKNGCKEKKKSTDKKQNRSKTEAKQKQIKSKQEGNVNDNVNLNEECKSKLESINVNVETWKDFVEFRKEIKKPVTERVEKRLLKDLTEFENKNKGFANLALENSIKNSWQGVFEPKGNNQSQSEPANKITRPEVEFNKFMNYEFANGIQESGKEAIVNLRTHNFKLQIDSDTNLQKKIKEFFKNKEVKFTW